MDKLENVIIKFFEFDKLVLESKQELGPITAAYETYGKLNSQKSNAILVCHALSGDSHAAGLYKNEQKPGWWSDLIGQEKAIDTNKYFVICANVLAGCKGTTGPSSLNPLTNKPYALKFPLVTINDMVDCQKKLIEHLGIKRLLSVVGGSMGGLQVLSWLVRYPEMIASAIPIATTLKHSPQQIAFNEVGRQAIMADINWNNGDYYGKEFPVKGLAVARMIGHITYMSDVSMEEKFGRLKLNDKQLFNFTADFEVEGYLRYRGDSFVKRFDANSYLYITKAMDNFDAFDSKNFHQALQGVKVKILVIAFSSDWLYPAYQSKEIVRACKLSGIEATYCEIKSTYGHDAFLLEVEEESKLIEGFLKNI